MSTHKQDEMKKKGSKHVGKTGRRTNTCALLFFFLSIFFECLEGTECFRCQRTSQDSEHETKKIIFTRIFLVVIPLQAITVQRQADSSKMGKFCSQKNYESNFPPEHESGSLLIIPWNFPCPNASQPLNRTVQFSIFRCLHISCIKTENLQESRQLPATRRKTCFKAWKCDSLLSLLFGLFKSMKRGETKL